MKQSSVLLFLTLGVLSVRCCPLLSASHHHHHHHHHFHHHQPLLLLSYMNDHSVVQASQGLVNNFVGLTQALPGVGRRLQGMPGGGIQGEGE